MTIDLSATPPRCATVMALSIPPARTRLLAVERLTWLPWVLLAGGLAALYVPTLHRLLNGLWATETHAHGPIVLLTALWYFWFKGRQLHRESTLAIAPVPLAGGLVFGIGLLLYVIGRSQEFLQFEVGSMLPVALGLTLIVFGWGVARPLWFAFFFLMFVVPVPGSVVDAITQPMKMAVSWGAEWMLYELGYPVARSGVVITIGAYQLLVADACAGLNSLFTLEATGLLYINVVRHESPSHNLLLALLIVPISYAANVIRVLLLSQITYHWGDEAGQGFLHVSSGFLMFVLALLLILVVDAFLVFVARKLFRQRLGGALRSGAKA
jgi:exosortase B